jgi:hypothetical protein
MCEFSGFHDIVILCYRSENEMFYQQNMIQYIQDSRNKEKEIKKQTKCACF